MGQAGGDVHSSQPRVGQAGGDVHGSQPRVGQAGGDVHGSQPRVGQAGGDVHGSQPRVGQAGGDVVCYVQLGPGLNMCALGMLVPCLMTPHPPSPPRSLWSMRNYVHIQLCASLFVAQLIFVAGVEPRGSEVRALAHTQTDRQTDRQAGLEWLYSHPYPLSPPLPSPPLPQAACSVVAVLLHYAFLVSFMWMLMEGVVLYVALVRVFVEHHLRYIIAFTVASYGEHGLQHAVLAVV